MKIIPLFFLLMLLMALPILGQTQNRTIESIMAYSTTNLPVYDTATCKDCIFLHVEFGTSNFLNLDVLKRFKEGSIQQVDMVFTSFSRTKSFDQAALNRERLTNLENVAPELFDEKIKQWNVICQTAPTSYEESSKYFHGFVVKLRPGIAQRDKEGKLTPKAPEAPIKKPVKIKEPPRYRDTIIVRPKVVITKKVKKDCKMTGKFLPRSKDKRKKGVRYEKETVMVLWKRKPEKVCTELVSYKTDTIMQKKRVRIDNKTGKPVDESAFFDRSSDATVPEAMTRNWDDWKTDKIIVVQDVTGSMSSYLTQILAWNEEYAKKGVENFLFFNDGDNKTDKQKVIGRTGGIYFVKSNNINDIQRTADRAMSNGSGGDTPENNVEALIAAQTKCKDCTAMVMIADNMAAVKDMKLLAQIKKPVHVLVCGASDDYILADYVNIAALTKGSLHTATIDVDFKEDGGKSEVVKIGNVAFELKNGSYVPKY